MVWYCLDAPGTANLKLTDTLDIGDEKSEKAHRCAVDGLTWSGTTTSCYDRYEQQPPGATTTDTGRAFNKTSKFVVKLDPANAGVKIRRRANRHLANVQKAKVYVDGRIIPDALWYVCDLPVPDEVAFRDSDYEIPAKYTKGKTLITVKLEHIEAQPANTNNEYHYWGYCYGRTSLK